VVSDTLRTWADAQRRLVREQQLRDAVRAGANAVVRKHLVAGGEAPLLAALGGRHLVAHGCGRADLRLGERGRADGQRSKDGAEGDNRSPHGLDPF
jgi:hypothetical protein